MEGRSFSRAVLAGLIATIVMSIVGLMATLVGMPRMNTAAMLGSTLGVGQMAGWTLHLVIGGLIFAAAYAYVFEPRLPGAAWVRGLIYGMILAVFVMAVGFPLVKMMVGARAAGTGGGGAMSMVGPLLGHLVYGAVLGGVYGQAASTRGAKVTGTRA